MDQKWPKKWLIPNHLFYYLFSSPVKVGLGNPLGILLMITAIIYVQKVTKFSDERDETTKKILAIYAILIFTICFVTLPLYFLSILSAFQIFAINGFIWFPFFTLILIPATLIYRNENMKAKLLSLFVWFHEFLQRRFENMAKDGKKWMKMDSKWTQNEKKKKKKKLKWTKITQQKWIETDQNGPFTI